MFQDYGIFLFDICSILTGYFLITPHKNVESHNFIKAQHAQTELHTHTSGEGCL